ncbi:hypothetical protein [Lysobacter antibioticus]|jgi:hypothetical protein|uniref:Uncharacterized protein n=1 Tax=Lysobacter antibioticus TaxID=84531 RepID=A0A0S2FG08_LYSAN|nr:hypothetical protein [Lysobacter antibioticus]ALN82470.1 hypothetical protein LA76x_4359 [Lysobacter antibioticus]
MSAGDTKNGYEDILGVWVAPADEAATWHYRARSPGLASGADGRPQFALVSVGSVVMLALTSAWGVSAATLDAIRIELAARAQLPLERVTLRQAPVTVDGASLMLGDGKGAYVSLADSKSSGVPPYHAAFNVMLDGEQAAKVRKALLGEHGWMAVRYAVTDAAPMRRSASTYQTESVRVDVSLRSNDEEEAMSAGRYRQSQAETDDAGTAVETQQYTADAADWGLPRS